MMRKIFTGWAIWEKALFVMGGYCAIVTMTYHLIRTVQTDKTPPHISRPILIAPPPSPPLPECCLPLEQMWVGPGTNNEYLRKIWGNTIAHTLLAHERKIEELEIRLGALETKQASGQSQRLRQPGATSQDQPNTHARH